VRHHITALPTMVDCVTTACGRAAVTDIGDRSIRRRRRFESVNRRLGHQSHARAISSELASLGTGGSQSPRRALSLWRMSTPFSRADNVALYPMWQLWVFPLDTTWLLSGLSAFGGCRNASGGRRICISISVNLAVGAPWWPRAAGTAGHRPARAAAGHLGVWSFDRVAASSGRRRVRN
jgi:hypothetical protein